MIEEVTVRVPASTSNLGPGFDCLGVALRIYNHVTVARGRPPRAATPMIRAAAEAFFARAGVRPFAFRCEVAGDVPMARGLGSSVTVRLGLMHGLNALAGRPLKREEIYELCAELEGHPDNAAAAEFGGFNVVRAGSRQRFAVSAALKCVLLIPDFEVSTTKARALLPGKISRRGSVESCGNAAAITAAFASGKYMNLQGAFRDHLHQPFRKKLMPFLDDVIAAAEEAGALGGFLSGSGSTIAAVTLASVPAVARAMRSAATKVNAQTIITTADNRGARLLISDQQLRQKVASTRRISVSAIGNSTE
ncbi:MAG: homoserine kinase [Chthoniobacterales bacterium]|nr:homoserine kinase [Chthoniobacterales bacterium]